MNSKDFIQESKNAKVKYHTYSVKDPLIFYFQQIFLCVLFWDFLVKKITQNCIKQTGNFAFPKKYFTINEVFQKTLIESYRVMGKIAAV